MGTTPGRRLRAGQAPARFTPRRLLRLSCWAPAALWAYLLAGRGRWWAPPSRLPGDDQQRGPGQGERAQDEQDDSRWPAVAVIVPARNEAGMLPATFPALLAQDYPGPLQVVVVDDRSDDGTGLTARRLASSQPAGRCTVIDGRPLPPGWEGKPWAMAQGWQEATKATPSPEWALFTDADIHHPSSSVRRLVSAARSDGRQALSLMARLSVQSGWERLAMPAFVYFFAQIYPFPWVNDWAKRTAAAAGGCLLAEAEALSRAGSLETIKGSIIDDVALARALKASGARLWLGLAGDGSPGTAPEVRSLRRYSHLRDIWHMVARSAYTQLRNSPMALAGAVTGLGAVYLSPPVMAVTGLRSGRRHLVGAGLLAWLAMAVTYLPVARYYRVGRWTAAALPFTAALYTAMTVDSARLHRQGRWSWRR